MSKNHISLTSQCQNELTNFFLNKSESFSEQNMQDFKKKALSSDLQIKAKKCFVKLYNILTIKRISLYRTFVAYDADKSGQLAVDEFEKILKRLDGSFTKEEVEAVFSFIDKDKSKTIEFDELNSYYCKVNGIP